MAQLVHVSESKLKELRSSIDRNLDRYEGSGFGDLIRDPGWAIDLEQAIDLSGLEALDGSDNHAAADLKNTKIVEAVLGSLTPSLANEERIWVRLSHVEAFVYSRDRWVSSQKTIDTKTASIATHLFAETQTRIRDHNAISRLWWNAYVVKRCYPKDFSRGLELLLTRADVRNNIVERFWLTGRRHLAAGVFRKMDSDPRALKSEESFREFMKALNFLGGGIVFETLTESQIDGFLSRCLDQAQLAMESA